MKPIYQLKIKDDKAELYIYGDIASDGYKWNESDISANDIVTRLKGLTAKTIDVYINSYGGEVAEGLAIYNVLKRHSAKITTYVDGFACSIASVIAMAGDVRKMYDNSLLMIHNAWTTACGNAEQLTKAAKDLETINEATKKAYLDVVNISETELKALLDAESWITAEKAVEMGFATEVVAAKKPVKASASAQSIVYALLTKAQEETPAEQGKEPEAETDGDNIENVLADIVERLEKLEKEVFDNGKEQEPGKENPNEPEQKIDFMKSFINALS